MKIVPHRLKKLTAYGYSLLKFIGPLIVGAALGALLTFFVGKYSKKADDNLEVIKDITIAQSEINHRIYLIDTLMSTQQRLNSNNFVKIYTELPLGSLPQLQKIIENSAFFECAVCTHNHLMNIQNILDDLGTSRKNSDQQVEVDDPCYFYQILFARGVYTELQETLTQYLLYYSGAQDKNKMYKNLTKLTKRHLDENKMIVNTVNSLLRSNKCGLLKRTIGIRGKSEMPSNEKRPTSEEAGRP